MYLQKQVLIFPLIEFKIGSLFFLLLLAVILFFEELQLIFCLLITLLVINLSFVYHSVALEITYLNLCFLICKLVVILLPIELFWIWNNKFGKGSGTEETLIIVSVHAFYKSVLCSSMLFSRFDMFGYWSFNFLAELRAEVSCVRA